jgi:transcriptional regulator with XRE-family HTH domain
MLTLTRCTMHNMRVINKPRQENNRPVAANGGPLCPTCGSVCNPLALAIRAIRKRLGLTQAAFAEVLFLRQCLLSRFETGAERPSTERLIRLLRMAVTDGERAPIVAVLEQRGILASDLAISTSTPLLLHETRIGAPVGGVNV